MSDFGMFGLQEGVQAFQSEQGLRQAQTLDTIANAQYRQAATERERVGAQKDQLELQDEMKMRDVLQGMAGMQQKPQQQGQAQEQGKQQQPQQPDPNQITSQLDQLSQAAMDAGLYSKASDIATKSATIREKVLGAQSKQTSAQLNQLKQLAEKAKLVGQYLGNATDQESWDQGHAMLASQGIMLPTMGKPFSAQAAKMYADESKTAHQQVLEAAKGKELERQDRSARETERYHNSLLSIRGKEADERVRMDNWKQKTVGDKSPIVHGPTKEGRTQASELIKQDKGLEGLPDDERDYAVDVIASEAQALLQKHRGLDMNTATEQAFKNHRGEFSEVAKTFLGLNMGKQAHFEKGSGGPAVGTVMGGYKFKGGNPKDKANWVTVGGGDDTEEGDEE